jgi:hypothetical protein
MMHARSFQFHAAQVFLLAFRTMTIYIFGTFLPILSLACANHGGQASVERYLSLDLGQLRLREKEKVTESLYAYFVS